MKNILMFIGLVLLVVVISIIIGYTVVSAKEIWPYVLVIYIWIRTGIEVSK